MSEALKFWVENSDWRGHALSVSTVVRLLDALDLEKDQDWDAETTTWRFPDGSAIRVNSFQEVDCLDAKGDSK